MEHFVDNGVIAEIAQILFTSTSHGGL
jgi:hypothetical protein